MTLALAYLAGMASMAALLFLRGAREVSDCESCKRLEVQVGYQQVLIKEYQRALAPIEEKHADHLRMVDDVMDRLSGWQGAIK